MAKQSTVHLEVDRNALLRSFITAKTNYQIILKDRCFEMARRLAEEVGQPIAQWWFGSAVRVSAEPMRGKSGYRIVADGKAVCFLEFGAGAATDSFHDFAQNVSFKVYPGSWSENHSNQYATQGYWMFGGRRYEKVIAKRGLYHAYKEMVAEAPRIASEVFK